MSWMRSRGPAPTAASGRNDPAEAAPAAVVRATPGVAALFDGLVPDGSHVVLDLGPAAEPHFRLYSDFARRIRFADLLPTARYGAAWAAADQALPRQPQRLYDVVLAWNFLDWLTPEERPLMVERLDEITAPGARLYTAVDASGEHVTRPLRFTLRDVGHLSQEVAGPPEPAGRQLLPAEVERLLAPFEVVHAFTLRVGLREYVAVKRGEGS